MFADGWQIAFFPVAVAAMSLSALSDHVCIGLRRAEWSAIKNVLHAVIKPACRCGMASLWGRQGIVATWY